MSSLQLTGTVRLGETTLAYELGIAAGERLTVIGPNGAGKSTLLRTLAGLQRLATGSITQNGRRLDDPAAGVFVPAHDRDITLQPQSGALFPHLTVLDNAAFPARSSGQGRSQARARAGEMLDRLGILDLAPRYPASLSGGEAAKAALARSLLAEPAVLLLDEPAAALDVTARADLRHRLADLDTALVTVTHDPVEARLLGDRLVVVDGGRIVQAGTVDEVADAPRSSWVAGLLGVNLVSGAASGTHVTLPDGGLTLAEWAEGPVHVTFPANAVTLHRDHPTGSARNAWPIVVEALGFDGPRVSVTFSGPVAGRALVTTGAVADLGLRPGGRCWASVKATELTVLPA